MKTLRILGLSVVAGASIAAADIAAVAQEAAAGPRVTLDQVLEAVRAERNNVTAENQEREARFVRERNQQQAELNRVRGQVQSEEATSTALEGQRNENELRLEELRTQLAERQGEFAELFGAARSAAGDLAETLDASLVTAQFPGRSTPLREIAQSDTLPSIEQLEFLWETFVQEGVEQGKVVTFEGQVVGNSGDAAPREVTRIGPFTAFSGGDFLVFKSGEGTVSGLLSELPRQPGGGATDAARRVENYTGDGYVEGIIDPSLGALLEVVVDSPTFKERVDQGGEVGYAIIVIAVLGVLLAVYKWVTLTMTAGAVRGQMRSKKPSKSNPLGRVMLAYEANRNVDVETLQLKLDDAVLKELPRLESGLNLVKVIAAVAPLMGLLGTVVGMINTFQAITLFGTGDPKMMAGGISQALVTTVEGLIAAIPLLLLHSFAAGASKRVTQILEEQSAGMIAEHAEGRQ